MQTNRNPTLSALKYISKFSRINTHKLYYRFIRCLPYSQQKVLATLKGKDIFILVSTGRTGTTLFANMLNSIQDCYVEHEPIPNEQYFHRKSLEYPFFSSKYIKDFRLKEIYFRIKKMPISRYGEVNGALRRNIKEIKETLPESRIIHIVRDGRDVVSSVLNRNTLTPDDKNYYGLVPDSSIISKKDWTRFDRFQKIAFMWYAENMYMRNNSDFTVRFEDLISSYELACTNFFSPLNLPIDYETWKKFIGQKMNARKNNKEKFKYENWTEDQKHFFNKVCGKEMKQYGYY